MADPVFVHGKNGTISINGNLFNALTFTYVDTSNLEDITYCQGNATSQVMIPSYRGISGTINFVYDTANKPTVAPRSLVSGTLVQLVLRPDGVDAFTFSAYTGTFQWGSGPQNGAVKCSTTFQSTSPITWPNS